MGWGTAAVAGASILGGMMGQQQQAEAQRQANIANMMLAQQSAAESGRQFDIGMDTRELDVARQQEMTGSRRTREDEINRMLQGQFGERLGALDPYAQTGQQALQEQRALLGLGGTQEQEAAMQRFTESPGQQFLRERQEKSLLRNAAALGGLGGANVQTALQEQAFGRAQTGLQERIGQLGDLAGRGQQAASAGLQYAPGYVQTGTDIGVATETPSGPEFNRYEAPPAYDPDSPPGMFDFLDFNVDFDFDFDKALIGAGLAGGGGGFTGGFL